MNKKIFITTSIPYVNGAPHIGHALEYVQSDALARAYRLLGFDTYFVTGTDENAQKNVESAEKEGIPVEKLVERNSHIFQSLKTPLNITFDDFIRTSSLEKHKKGSQKLWTLCTKDIYKKIYQGLYCVGCETFYKDGEFPDNICPLHKRKLDLVEEENYFFALSRYQAQIREVITSGKLAIFPEFRKQEIVNFIDKGLEDFSISRPTERVKGWGIPVPNDDSQRMYVWFDALTNYITVLDFDTDGELYKKYWKENENRVHIIGKDIIKFHAIYWIGMLLSANLPLPTKEYVHGFITVDGQKMSKSIGNIIDPFQLVEKYGTDAVRYYLLKEIPSLDDGDFSHDRMHQLYTADLANELGNLVSRLTTLAEKDGLVIEKKELSYSQDTLIRWEQFELNVLLEELWQMVKNVNRSINEFTPWSKAAEERKEFLVYSLETIHTVGQQLLPFMPETAEKIIQATTGKIAKIEPLFPRLG